MSDSLVTTWTEAHQAPWDSPGENTGVGWHLLLQGIFPIWGWNSVSCIAGRFLTTEPSGKPQRRAKGEQKRCLMYTLRQLPTFSTSFLYSFTNSCTDPSIHPSDLFHPYHAPGMCWALGHRDLKTKTRQFLLGRNSHSWSPRFHSSPDRWRGCDAQKKGGLPQGPTVSGPASRPSPPFHELFTLNPWIYLWNIQAQGSLNFNSWIDGFNSFFFFSTQNFLLKKFFFRVMMARPIWLVRSAGLNHLLLFSLNIFLQKFSGIQEC